MAQKEFKIFCQQVLLGLILLSSILILSNLSGVFNYQELKSTPAKQWAHFSELEGDSNSISLIVGNSKAMGLNPKILDSVSGGGFFFQGYGAISIKTIKFLLANDLVYFTPNLVVIETHVLKNDASLLNDIDFILPRKEQSNSLPYHLVYMPWSLQKIKGIPDIVEKEEWDLLPLLFAGPTFRHHEIIETHFGLFAEAILKPNKFSNYNKGFFSKNYPPIEDKLLSWYKKNPTPVDDWVVQNEALAELEEVLTLCREKKIQAVLLEAPLFYKHQKPQTKRFKQLNEIATKHNVPFIHFENDSTITHRSEYFQNTFNVNQHLTVLGADTLSLRIARQLKGLLEKI